MRAKTPHPATPRQMLKLMIYPFMSPDCCPQAQPCLPYSICSTTGTVSNFACGPFPQVNYKNNDQHMPNMHWARSHSWDGCGPETCWVRVVAGAVGGPQPTCIYGTFQNNTNHNCEWAVGWPTTPSTTTTNKMVPAHNRPRGGSGPNVLLANCDRFVVRLGGVVGRMPYGPQPGNKHLLDTDTRVAKHLW